MATRVSRRHFLATAAATGVLLGFRVGPVSAAGPATAPDFAPNAFIRITPSTIGGHLKAPFSSRFQ